MSSENRREFRSECEECGAVCEFDLTEDEWCDDEDLLECTACGNQMPIAIWNAHEVA